MIESINNKMSSDLFSNNSYNYIFDRSHLGELVYAPLYRKYSGDYILDIEKQYVNELKDNLFMFVFVNDPETILKRDDGLSFYKNVEEVKIEKEAFEEAFNKSKIYHKYLINVSNHTPEEINNQIKNIILKANQ